MFDSHHLIVSIINAIHFHIGSGEVDFDEFTTMLKKILAPPSDEELMMKFKV